jgi:hypothetical protein
MSAKFLGAKILHTVTTVREHNANSTTSTYRYNTIQHSPKHKLHYLHKEQDLAPRKEVRLNGISK